MPYRKKALIAGATGVVGRNLLRHLLTLDDWDVIAVSRRKPDVEGRYEHVPIDLLDRAQTFEALKRQRGVTHVFFSAYFELPTWAEMVAPNQTMLVNLMDAIETASPNLAHVNLMHGTKWYGNHLGPFKRRLKKTTPGTCRQTSTTISKTLLPRASWARPGPGQRLAHTRFAGSPRAIR